MRARRRTHRRARRQPGLEEDQRQQETNVTIVRTFLGRWCQRTSAAQRAEGSIGIIRGTSTVASDRSSETLVVEEFLIVATVMHTRAQRAEDVMWLILVTTAVDAAPEDQEELRGQEEGMRSRGAQDALPLGRRDGLGLQLARRRLRLITAPP